MINTNLKNGKLFLMPYFQNQKSATNFDPPNRRWGPFYHWGAPKIVVFSEKSAVYLEYECRSNTTYLSNTLGVMLLKNNTCCFCCQKLLILSKPEKHRHHKCILNCGAVGKQHLLLICCHRGLPLTCRQIVILLKI